MRELAEHAVKNRLVTVRPTASSTLEAVMYRGRTRGYISKLGGKWSYRYRFDSEDDTWATWRPSTDRETAILSLAAIAIRRESSGTPDRDAFPNRFVGDD